MARFEIEGSLEALCCVLEHETFSSSLLVLLGKHPKMTERLLTGTQSINTQKIKLYVVVHKCTYKNCLTEAFTNY